jgi:hypothetical protein
VGDTLLQIKGGELLCSPFAFDIQLQLQKPPTLSQAVRCSLPEVIGNIKSYRDNFQNGGWLGYQELLKPQNNQWGAEIIIQNEIMNVTAQKTNASVLKNQVNIGFNSEACTGGWDLINTQNGGKVSEELATSIGLLAHDGDTSHAPNDPPKISDIILRDYTVKYVCAKSTVTTPGSALAAGLEKSLYSSLDFVINAQELSASLAIIADAAFNRLIKAGVGGLKDMISSETTTGVPATPASVSASTAQAIGGYESTQNQTFITTQNIYLGQLNPASSTIKQASLDLDVASSTNESVIKTTTDLISSLESICPTSLSKGADLAWASSTLDTASFSTRQTITNKYAEIRVIGPKVGFLISLVTNSTNLTELNQISQQDISDAVNKTNNLNLEIGTILSGVSNTLTNAQTKLEKCKNP